MKQKTIFNERGIKVIQEDYDGIRGRMFLITDGINGFSVGEKPKMEYKYLFKQLTEYIREKQEDIASDVEDYRDEDIAGFWERGTEGF